MLAERRLLTTLLLTLAVALVVLAQLRMTQAPLSTLTIGAMLLGLALFVTFDVIAAPAREANAPRAARLETPSRQGLRAGAGVLGWFVWTAMRQRQTDEVHADIVVLWLLSLGLALAAAWPAINWRPGSRGVAVWERRRWVDVATACGVTLTALLARIVALDRFPNIFDADEAAMAMSAVEIVGGNRANPFGTGWFGHPILFFYLQAGSIWLFGDSVFGVRMLSALLGTLAVLFTWLLTRRLFGQRTAVLAASILAIFHFHLQFSRTALNNVADSLFLIVTLFFLDRGFGERRRLDCLLAGMSVGISQYFYTSARLIPLVAAVVALHFGMTILIRRSHTGSPQLNDLRSWTWLVGWMLAGAGLTYLPLLASYVNQPDNFAPRIQALSIFASGWLAQEQQTTGLSAIELIARNWWRAALVPFHLDPVGTYRGRDRSSAYRWRFRSVSDLP